LYAVNYGGGALTKYTASSGYTDAIPFPSAGSGNAGLAINGAQHRIYIASGGVVKSYDTATGSLVETIDPGGGGASDVAVDEATDTLFIVIGSGGTGYISERPG